MHISLQNVGKKYNNNWIFKKLDFELESGKNYSILGGNGSGKSTLLQLISGFISPNEGSISLFKNGQLVDPHAYYSEFAIAAPYQDIIENLTLKEGISFHKKFKSLTNDLTVEEFMDIAELTSSSDKLIGHFSSGMKQRLKLALAILSDTPFLLLDEPAMNLDERSTAWYTKLIKRHQSNRIVVVSSNYVKQEYDFEAEPIDIEKYK